MKKTAVLVGVAALGFASVASAQVVWDQQPDFSQAAFVDQQFGDFPTFSTYQVHDVVFGGATTITSVTTYFTLGFGNWNSGITSAVLNIFSDPVGSGDDPTTGITVPIVISNYGGGLAVTASGLSINVGAGTSWVGLTPIADFGVYGQEFHAASLPLVGANTLARNPGGDFGVGTDWVQAGPTFGGVDYDGAITIEGVPVPAPGALALLALGGLAARRRR